MMISKTTMPSAALDNLPDELKELDQWVVWNSTKAPMNVRTGKKAEVDNLHTWSSFEKAREAVLSGKYKGMSFVLSKDDPYTIIKLNHAIDLETGKALPWAQAIIEQMNSYTEVSQGGTGIHIIVRGKKPSGRCRTGNIEIYDQGWYFGLTYNLWEGGAR